MAIKIEFEINLWIVGDSEETDGNISPVRVNAPGAALPGPLFSIGKVTLIGGVTKKNEFTLGKDGRLSLTGFGYYNTKKSFIRELKRLRMKLSDYMEVYKWLLLVKQRDSCKFTDAFINSISRKTHTNHLWINQNWEVNHCVRD